MRWLWVLCLAPGLLLGTVLLAAEPNAASGSARAESGRIVRPKVGEALADFSLKDVKGKTVKLSDFRGKSIFVLELGACT